ncbi:uncharacterized protein N7482_007310 [Penicillium canariense]|uniref:MYND-type domain-containing protein n=1 Tax=Penicillium canariense TaxID=189055 RepID=A0A9W9LKG5_9EURO|nr:uncharacterized protein N7482_007310 [Penicillium canariense]KAJ5160306.1 hypothetical protein N7482_007310 [Penicillium canariense]
MEPPQLFVSMSDLTLGGGTESILPSGCAICPKQEDLHPCPSCVAIRYCSDHHRKLDRPSHRLICEAIRSCRTDVEEESQRLRQTPESYFNINTGIFWELPETTKYLVALAMLVQSFRQIKHKASIELQLTHIVHVLRLGRRDFMGYRYQVPALMLRLHKDQECYDFLKWWIHKIPSKININIRLLSLPSMQNLNLPCVGCRNENPFEPVNFFSDKIPITTLIPLTLLKIKLLFDLERLELSTSIFGLRLPAEISILIMEHVPISNAVAGDNGFIASKKARRTTITRLKEQIHLLYCEIKDRNPHFWSAMVYPVHQRESIAANSLPRTVSEVQTLVRWNYESWIETPGAIAVMQNLKG